MIKKIIAISVLCLFSTIWVQPFASDVYQPTAKDDTMLVSVEFALSAMNYQKLKDIEMRLFVLLSDQSFEGRVGYFLDSFLGLLNERIEELERKTQEEKDDLSSILEELFDKDPVIQEVPVSHASENVVIANEGESVLPTDWYLEKLLADYSPSTSNARWDFSLRIKNSGDTFLKNSINLNIHDEIADIQCSVDGSGLVAARPVKVQDIQDIEGDNYFDMPMIVYPGHLGLNMDPKPFLRTTGEKTVVCKLLMKNVSAATHTETFDIQVIE